MNSIDRLYNLKEKTLHFLTALKGRKIGGYYRYSYSGDLYGEGIHWNVGSSVFALKIYYTLGIEDNNNIQAVADYINTFQHVNGWIYDDLVFRKSFLRNAFHSIKQGNFSNLWNKQYKWAETRQCCSALLLYDKLPDNINLIFPRTENAVDKYLSSFDWNQPWAAGGHFSHLMFFLSLALKMKKIEHETFELLTNCAIGWVNRLQHSADGSWYTGSPDTQQKINGAMKVLTGFIAVDKTVFNYPRKLVDLCLDNANDENACDNFNIVLVLNYAGKLLNRSYRQPEIEKFALRRLNTYWQYYHSDKGGFSFYRGRANDCYYGARITKGLNEPDIHGTVLFLWGISIIVQMLGLEKKLGFREFKT